MNRRLLCCLVAVVACAMPAHAEDTAVSDAQLLTKQVLELRQRVNDLERQLVDLHAIADAFQVRQAREVQPLAAEQQAIEADWKTLEADLRKTLKPKDGAVLDRKTLTFTDPHQ